MGRRLSEAGSKVKLKTLGGDFGIRGAERGPHYRLRKRESQIMNAGRIRNRGACGEGMENWNNDSSAVRT